MADVLERLLAKVDMQPSGCWVWTAHTYGGYGRFTIDRFRSSQKAHRVAYELLVRPLAEGEVLHHVCGNTRCVNPEHLEPMRQAEHARIGDSPPAQNARKTHCKNGHAFTSENTYTWNGWRYCRTCLRAKEAARTARRKEARHASRAAKTRLAA